MVMNIGALKSGLLDSVETDIRAVAREVKKAGKLLKVIIEAPLLRDDEKKIACKIATAAGADFVKSCTGFADGANVADIRLMRETVGGQMGVKASGGIRSLDDAVRMIEAGANRIGTSSGVKIMEEYAKQQIDS
jgi:deoxyribose-phosphate aldolase